jgi:hypothetical protein
MFTPSERERFTTHGLFKRQGFLSSQKLANARSLIFEHLEQAGIWRDGSWHFEQTAPDSGMALIKPLNQHPAIAELASGETFTAASELADYRLEAEGTRRYCLLCQTQPPGRSRTKIGIWISLVCPKAE